MTRSGGERYAVGLYRVSTAGQGQSGLGLEVQRASVRAFAAAQGWTLVAEFSGIASGKDGRRPGFQAVLTRCRQLGAVLAAARLDRITRRAHTLPPAGCGHGGAAHQGGPECGHMDPAVLPPLRRERGAAATARSRLQPRQLPPYPDVARGGQPLVDDHVAGQAGQDRCEDRPAWALDHLPDGRGHGLAPPVPTDPRRRRGAASVAGGPMLRGDTLTSQTDHRQERCVTQSAKSAEFASKRRTHRWLRGEPRDHWPAGIDRCRQPRLSFTPDVRMGRSCGECRLTSRHRASRTP